MHRVGNHGRRTPQYTEGKLQGHKQQIHYTAQHRNAVNIAFTRIHNTFYFTSMKNGTTPVTDYKCIEKIKYPGNVICRNLTHTRPVEDRNSPAVLAAGAANSLSSPSFRRNSSRLNRWKTRAEKRAFQVLKIENWFSERLPRMGEKKKLVARILKSEPLILKSKPLIFCPLKTRPADAGNQWSFGHKTVCYMPRKRGQKPTAVCRAGGALSPTGHQASSNCVLMPGRQLCARLKA